MNKEQYEISRGITLILISLRSSLNLLSRARFSENEEARTPAKELMLLLEAARFSAAVLSQRDQTDEKFARSLIEVRRDLENISGHWLFRELRGTRYRPRPDPSPDAQLLFQMEPRFLDKDISTGNVVDLLIETIERLGRGSFVQPELPGIRQLREIVPAQKIAPVQFDVRDGRLVVVQRKSDSEPQDQANVKVAAEELRAQGRHIVDELKASNCDRRLIETVEYLQEQLSHETNVIQIGLTNIGCGIMCETYQSELPDAVVSMLRAHTVGVEMYVGQFPDWNRFVENAAAVQITDADVLHIRNATTKLIGTLEQNSQVVDPEVPRTFRYLSELVSNPARGVKRAAFAILRSIENLVSKVFSYGADFLDATAKRTLDGLASSTSKVLIISLLTLALNSAVDIAPVANKVREMSWIRNAIELVEKQIQQMGR